VSVIFADSFGHYDSLLTKWDAAGDNTIITNATIARTNNRCMQILSGASGPGKTLPANYAQLVGQVAVNADTPGLTQNPTIMQFQLSGVGYNIGIRVNGNGSMAIWRGPGDTGEVPLSTSTLRPWIWGGWCYVEAQCTFSSTVGFVTVWVNGQQIMQIGPLRTVAFAADQFSNAWQLFGNGGGLWYMADAVIIDPTVSPNNGRIPQTKIYAQVPNANGTPTSWIPFTGTNFSEVNTIPPPGDTSYCSSSNVGDIDQYLHPSTGIPVDSAVAALQHCLALRSVAGAVTVNSDLAGTVATPGFALTTSYLIYHNPSDGPWSLGSFPVAAGPKLTA